MKLVCLILFSLAMKISLAQDKPGTSFYINTTGDPNVCPKSANYVSSADVENMITLMLGKFSAKNRYIIKACPQIDNCQATLYKGKPYILYNPDYLNKVKRLNFSTATLPDANNKDWETLTVLAHELGHHINNHLINPLPDATQRSMEIEADETAGFIIYLLGGSLNQAQLAYYNADVSINGDYEHPPRQQRLDAVAKGYQNASGIYRPINDNDEKFMSSINNLLKRIDFDLSISDILAFEHGEEQRNAIPYDKLTVAPECKPNVVKYYWRYLKDTRLSGGINEFLNNKGLAGKFTADSYINYFFYNNKLARIELRLYADATSSQKLMSALGQDIMIYKNGHKVNKNGVYYKTSITEEQGWIDTHISISTQVGSTFCFGSWFDN